MKVRETGPDEFTVLLTRKEAGLLKTAALYAAENDGRDITVWTQFADDLAYCLHHELTPHNARTDK